MTLLMAVTCVPLPGFAQPVRITQSPLNDSAPVWQPGGTMIAYLKADAGNNFQIGAVESDGTNERFLGTGAGDGSGYFGYAFSLSWVGSGPEILTCERFSIHEFLAFDSSMSPFNRFISNGSDAANAQKLRIASGGDMIRASRNGSTVLWRDRVGTSANLRVAPYTSLTGQYSNTVGTVALSGSESYGIKGAALNSNGSKYVIALPSGSLGGWDLFLGNTSGLGPIVQLTTTGQDSGLDNYSPDVSPDGSEIIFARGTEGSFGSFDIFKIDIDGSNLVQLTYTPLEEGGPSWAPDGVTFAYNRFDTDLPDAEPDNWNIYVTDGEPEPPTLLAPNGGEELMGGQTYTIRWEGGQDILQIMIDYSTDNGGNWNPIDPALNDGQYEWTVPQETSEDCLVRISDASDPSEFDVSDAVFRIYECLLFSPADLDNDCKVGLGDLMIMARDWLRNGNPVDPGFTEAPQ